MRVLVACEFSGRVRQAFELLGHEVVSCDLLPALDDAPNHVQGDVLQLLQQDSAFDLMVAFPPCTHLCVSGARWFEKKKYQQAAALAFVRALLSAPIPRIALENPVGVISTHIAKPSQIIQPWEFGVPEAKSTCLWLKNLPPLKPTHYNREQYSRIHAMPKTALRGLLRSVTYPEIALAMALQWGAGFDEAACVSVKTTPQLVVPGYD